jgi:hypothetical protein
MMASLPFQSAISSLLLFCLWYRTVALKTRVAAIRADVSAARERSSSVAALSSR